MKSSLLSAVIIALALLMWYSNSSMFIRLESLMGHSTSIFATCLQSVLALGYSSLTAICVRYLPDLKYVRFFAAFDGVSIVLHWASGIPDSVFSWIGSAYYGGLMYFLVTMIWRLSDMKRQEEAAKNAIAEKEAEEAPKALAIESKEEKKYETLKSLNGAIARGHEPIEFYFNRAIPEVQQEYLERNPNVTIKKAQNSPES